MAGLSQMLLDLLRINSISGSEEYILKFLKHQLSQLGLDYVIQQVDSRYNILVNPWQPAMICAHVDTAIYFPPQLQGNTIYGAGAADAKAGVCLMLELIKEFRHQLESIPVGFCFLVDEEQGGLGSAVFCQECLPELGIILEPTELAGGTICSGSLELEIKLRSRAQHPAGREDDSLTRKIKSLLELLEAKPDKQAHPVLGEFQLKLLEIHAGNGSFRTPDLCRIKLELIYLPHQSLDGILSWMKFRFPTNLEFEIWDHSPSYSSRESELLKIFLEVIASKLGEARSAGIRCWTDANNFHEFGSSWVVFGPGKIDSCHTRYECIELAELEIGYQVLREFILRMARSSNRSSGNMNALIQNHRVLI